LQRVESLVLQTARARELVTAQHVSTARAAHAQAVARGQDSNVLAHLARQLDPAARASVQKLYHMAMRAESTSDSGSGTTHWELTPESPRAVDPNMTYMEAVPRSSDLGSTRADTSSDLGRTQAPSRSGSDAGAVTYAGRTLGPRNAKTLPSSGRTLPPSDAGLTFNAPGPEATLDPALAKTRPSARVPTQAPLGLDTTHSAPTHVHGSDPNGETVTVPRGRSGRAQPVPVTEIPGYRIDGELGRGGMGVVYRATAEDDGTSVAIKVLLAGAGASADDLSRFRTEASAAARLEHPNIVRLLEHGETDGNPFMVLEFVGGEDLDAKIKREGALDPEEAVEIAVGIADALAYAHEQGILHRDLKPQNVLLDDEGAPLLTDFGLAKLKGEAAPTVSLTQSGMLLGTPAYMSPEQASADRHKIDERTDLYGIGATLFHMLTGSRPFEAETLAALILKIINDPAPRLRSLDPELDPDLETIALKCLEKHREDRYQTAGQLLRDLTRWQKNLKIVAAPPSIATKAQRVVRKNPIAAASAGFASVVLLIALLIGWNSMRQNADLQARLAAMEEGRAGDLVGSSQEPTPPAEPTPARPADERPAVESPADPAPVNEAPPEESPSPREEPPASNEPALLVDAPVDTPIVSNPVDETPDPADEASDPADPADEASDPADPADEASDPADPPPPSPSAPPADEPVAQPPPGWLLERLRRLDERSTPAYVPTWQAAQEEARALNVPLVVILLGPGAKRLSSYSTYLKHLDALAVAVIGQGPHPPKGAQRQPPPRHRGGPNGPGPKGGQGPGPGPNGGQGPGPNGGQGPGPNGGQGPGPGPGPNGGQGHPQIDPTATCPQHDGLLCGDHDTAARRSHDAGVAFGEDDIRLVVFTPDGAFRQLGAKRGGDFKLRSTSVKKALAEVQAELGPPRVPLEALDSVGARMVQLEQDEPDRRGPRFVGYADQPGLLGEWARFRAREACEGAIRRANGDRVQLTRLRERYGEEPGCARLIEQALSQSH